MNEHGVDKLILAVLQGDDYAETVSELNRNGFSVTLLSSTGGFLKKKSTTVMIGVSEERLAEVLDLLKRCARRRKRTIFREVTVPHTGELSAMPLIPVDVEVGGAAVFVLNVQQMEKY